MESASLVSNLVTLGLLIVLQAVLGFDNLLYVSLESKKAPAALRARARQLGIGLAIGLRILLLFVLVSMIQYFQEPVFEFHGRLASGSFNVHSLIVLLGGAFIVYTATKEVLHMMGLEEEMHAAQGQQSFGKTIFWIVLMNVVFSFDSILSAMALTNVFWVMATAIVTGGILMIWLSDSVSKFLQRNRMYEVLGLFILFVVGIMLLSEGGHLAHLSFFGHEITAMSKATFYFVIAVLVITDIVQGRYQQKLQRLKLAQESQSVAREASAP